MAAKTNRPLALDGLRLLCALAVAFYHLGMAWSVDGVQPTTAYLPQPVKSVLIYGFLGVEMFFMISGFVICLSGWDRTPREFLASRAARLYPAFWACVLITTAVMTVLPLTEGIPLPHGLTGADIAVNVTMLAKPLNVPDVDTVYWTLWYELRFYALFAILILIGLTRRRVVVTGAGWLVVSIVVPAGAPLAELVMPEFAPYFVAGITIYLIRRHGPRLPLWALLAACWAVSPFRVRERVLLANPRLSSAGLARMADHHAGLRCPGGHRPRSHRPLELALARRLRRHLVLALSAASPNRDSVRPHDYTGLPVPALIVAAVLVLLVAAWLVHHLVERPAGPALRRWIATGSIRLPRTAQFSEVSFVPALYRPRP
jgi:peptidoglycan/LPS O-acetylase OafA/YrhL